MMASSCPYTYRLEKELGWTGVLVDPSLRAFTACKANRPNSTVLNCALTDQDVDMLVGDFGNPMASVNRTRLSRSAVTVRAMSLTAKPDTSLTDRCLSSA